jgi:mannose-6-phosphate isomerase
MPPLYPLRFPPLLKRYLWGGRRLGEALGKPIGQGADYAESWEVVDHGNDQSVVDSGPLAGITLGELVQTRGTELLGRHAERHRGRSLQEPARFPLLFKYLDCQQDLSVQVHPGDAAAALLDPPDLGKTEAWVILDARAGSRIYAGLKAGCDRLALEHALRAGEAASCLHSFEPKAGDCVFIPAGTVHALGAGLLVAEIQQASDTTYRLFDWNRVGPDGRPRQLHIEPGLAAIDFASTAVEPVRPQPTERSNVERLVACDKFVLDRWRVDGEQLLYCDDQFHIVSVIDGELSCGTWNAADLRVSRGQTVLIPASVTELRLKPRPTCTLLDTYLPQPASNASIAARL